MEVILADAPDFTELPKEPAVYGLAAQGVMYGKIAGKRVRD